MKINFAVISIAFISLSACQTKNRSEDSFAQGASQEVAGADSQAEETKFGETVSTEITFTLSGTDSSISTKALVTYRCGEDYIDERELALNEEGETKFPPQASKQSCTIGLNSFVIGGNSYTPTEGEGFTSYDVGESGQFENGAMKYDLMVVSQLPSQNVHYQYSLIEEDAEEVEEIEDNVSTTPNQTPTQK